MNAVELIKALSMFAWDGIKEDAIRHLYTIVVDYRGGTYTSQFRSDTPTEAVREWGRTKPSGRGDIPTGIRSAIHKQLLDGEYLVALSGVKNVWCFSGTYRDQMVLINVVLTGSGSIRDKAVNVVQTKKR